MVVLLLPLAVPTVSEVELPSKRQFILTALTVPLVVWGPLTLLKLWAARHSTHDGVDGLIASAVQVAS